MDIEDLTDEVFCGRKKSHCAGRCPIYPSKRRLRLTFKSHKVWHKVLEINSIFEIIDSGDDRPYMLVAGNTAQGEFS